MIGVDRSYVGQPFTAHFRLEPGDDGSMPLLAGLSARSPFVGQKVVCGEEQQQLVLSGDPLFGPNGEFQGFEGAADPPGMIDRAEPKAADPHVQDLLRTPLDQIIESAGRIADRSEGPLRNEYAIYAADISAAAHHLLSVLRAMNQNGAAQPSRVDLAEVTEEAVGLIESAAIERDIAVAVEPIESCRANGEPRGVMQILVNLIGNAIRHSPAKSAVSISFERRDGTAIVHVADNGPGIAPADQDRIFERFEQGGESSQGAGLGLAIARRLARGMGGEIKLRSEPGAGSTFSLVLPSA
jgi:light-regulated signal transduction histidine kinase (bacteriophytochrome)